MTVVNRTFVIVAGGTGGHIYPGLAVATALRRAVPEASIHFIGTRKRMESRIIPEAGYPFHCITVEGIQRRLDWTGIWRNARAVLLLGTGLPVWQSLKILRRLGVSAVFATGGYFSGPVVLAARILGIPCVSMEPNVVPGLANRMMAFFLKKLVVTHEETMSFFRKRDLCVQIGTPVRPEFFGVSRADAVGNFNLDPDCLSVLVMGGSLGSKNINEAVMGALQLLAAGGEKYTAGIQIIHSSGTRFFDQTRSMKVPEGLNYRPMAYIDHVEQLLPGIDLFIGRAGAMSLAECTALGVPMILIPWRGVHQAKNAEILASKGAATLIYDDELHAERLYESLKAFIDDPEKRAAMAGESRKLGNPDAAGEVARILLDLSAGDSRAGHETG